MSVNARLPPVHFLLALLVVAVWGTNFVVIHLALRHFPPLLFAAARFTFAALPWVLVVKRPAVPWRQLVSYGVLVGVGLFGLVFIAMRNDISAGLASLVLQTQALFTVALAAGLLGERVRGFQLAALGLAAAGLGLIAVHSHQSATPKGLILVVLAALSWGGSNLIVKQAGPVNAMAYVIWASLFAVPPLVGCSLIFEGWPAITQSLAEADMLSGIAVLWQSVANTIFGYGAWS